MDANAAEGRSDEGADAPRLTTLTPPGRAAVAVHRLAGAEEALLRLDAHLFDSPSPAAVSRGAIRHRRLRDAAGEALDDILWIRPAPGIRLLCGHGGRHAPAALRARLRALGCAVPPAAESEHGAACALPVLAPCLGGERVPWVAETEAALAGARTEAQAALLLHSAATLPALLREAETSDAPAKEAERLAALADRLAWTNAFLRPRQVALLGPPNAGKSSLLNRLVGEARVLVEADPGTTRDAVEVASEAGGYALRLADTAGLGPPRDALDRDAQERTRALAAEADLLLLVLDASVPATDAVPAATRAVAEAARASGRRVLGIRNKTDLPPAWPLAAAGDLPAERWIETSALAADPAPVLREAIAAALGGAWDGTPLPFTERQAALLRSRAAALRARAASGA